jgi:hypothetical protein
LDCRGFWALQDGQRRQPGSGLVLWTASQSGMLPWAGGRRPPHQVSSPAQPHLRLPARRQPAPAAMATASANTTSTNHNPTKRPERCHGEVPHRSATGRIARTATAPATQGPAPGRSAGRDGRRASRTGSVAGAGASAGTAAASGHPGRFWHRGRHVRRAATFGQPRFLNSSGPGVCAGALGAGVLGGV